MTTQNAGRAATMTGWTASITTVCCKKHHVDRASLTILHWRRPMRRMLRSALLSATALVAVGTPGWGQDFVVDGSAEIVDGNGLDGGGGTGTLASPFNVNYLFVGTANSGALDILNGGVVSSVSGTVGFIDGSVGAVTVTGAGSTWNNSGPLAVGEYGNGTLTIADGGVVNVTDKVTITDKGNSVGTLNIGAATGEAAAAAGTLTTTGVRFGAGTGRIVFNHNDTGYTFAPSISGAGSVEVHAGTTLLSGTNTYTGDTTITGGQLIIDEALTGSSSISVGGSGPAMLMIRDGGTVSAGEVVIGTLDDTEGMVMVSGSSSSLTSQAPLIVGENGTATLLIDDGAQTSSFSGTIGLNAGSDGIVTVTGTGSRWDNTEDLTIGEEGRGTLVIADSGTVTNTFGVIGWESDSDSIVTVTGAGSTWTNSEELDVGFEGRGGLTITNGGTVRNTRGNIGFEASGEGGVTVVGDGSQWENSGRLSVGNRGSGILAVAAGGRVSNTDAYIGRFRDSDGTVTIDGSDSTWDINGFLSVGEAGSGRLTISDGGTVRSNRGFIGNDTTGTGTAIVTGEGSLWANNDDFSVGGLGAGDLVIAEGGRVSSGRFSIGGAGGEGVVTVDGQGSNLTSTDSIRVGTWGAGTMLITDGGTVRSDRGDVALFAGSEGTVVVAGAGSNWTNTSGLRVGVKGTGNMLIAEGGEVTGRSGLIGVDAGSEGMVSVTGAGSKWTSETVVFVGAAGTGTLNISDGGQVIGDSGRIGTATNGEGTVSVTGTGATWANVGALFVGGSGAGTLTIANGGTVKVGEEMTIASTTGSTGTLNIGAAAGEAAVGAGVLETSAINFGDGDGRIVFNHTDFDYAFASAINGAGAVEVHAGTTVLTGDSDYSGGTTVTGGTLTVNGSITGDTSVTGIGVLAGSGRVGNITIGNGGTLGAGNSIGALAAQDATFAAGGRYAVEVNSEGESDVLNASGAVTIDAGATLEVTAETLGEDGKTYNLLTRYTIITAEGGVRGVFDDVTDTFAFLDAALQYDPNAVNLSLKRNDVTFSELARTRNQRSTASGVASLEENTPVYDLVLMLPVDEVADAFDALSGEAHASAGSHLFRNSGAVADIIVDNMENNPGTMQATSRMGDSVSASRAAWATFVGSTAETEDNGNSAKLEQTFGGGFGGVDIAANQDWGVGVFLGASASDYDIADRRSSGIVNAAYLGMYGRAQSGPLGIKFGAVYGDHKVESEREVIVGAASQDLTADYDAYSKTVFAEASYDFSDQFQPFLKATHIRLDTDGFTESGGTAALNVAEKTQDVTFTTLGLRAQTHMDFGLNNVNLTGSFAWQHATGDIGSQVDVAFDTGSMFSIEGAPVVGDTFLVSAGADVDLDEKTSLRFGYAAQISNDDRSHALAASLTKRF